MRNTAILSNHQKQCAQNASTRESTETLPRCHHINMLREENMKQVALNRLNRQHF